MAKDNQLKQSAKSTDASKTSKASKTEKKPFGHKIRKYFKDLRSEIKKVVWPSKKQVVNNTSIVLAAIVISSVFIWGLDTIFSQVLKLILGA